jgi:hypothetical protein
MAQIINQEYVEKMLFAAINKQMQEAAEPVLQKALAEIERQMRERMAAMLIANIQSDFSVRTMGHDLQIIVRQAIPARPT